MPDNPFLGSVEFQVSCRACGLIAGKSSSPAIRKMTAVREEAFKDTTSIELLQSIFLDCLVRSKFPGVTQGHRVSIDRRTFWPEVTSIGDEDFAVTSFANMGI